MYKNIIIGLFVASSLASASNGVASEMSHLIGGAVLAAFVAFLFFRYSSKYRAKSVTLGFIASMAYVTVDQLIDYIKDGEFLNQFLDFSVHAIGSVIGAYLISLYIRKAAG